MKINELINTGLIKLSTQQTRLIKGGAEDATPVTSATEDDKRRQRPGGGVTTTSTWG